MYSESKMLRNETWAMLYWCSCLLWQCDMTNGAQRQSGKDYKVQDLGTESECAWPILSTGQYVAKSRYGSLKASWESTVDNTSEVKLEYCNFSRR